MHRFLSLALTAAITAALCACGSSSSSGSTSSSGSASEEKSSTSSLAFDHSKWNYDSDSNVYWQIGVQYCSTPADTAYETMGIYVPGEYMTGTKNSDGTYTCTVNGSGSLSGYTAESAPVVIPVNTPGYASSPAPTAYSYNDISSYMQAGFVYLQPGIRGRQTSMGSTSSASGTSTASGGAPWGVTDIKAAIRYYRLNSSLIPGSSDNVFTFGMSGGGAQSALVGSTGDSSLYTPYLESIGAAMTSADGSAISDAVAGSMCWCPITSLDYADEAYEWMMGQFASAGARADTSFGSALSEDLASAYADYINSLGLTQNGKTLTLAESSSGIYQSGSYYDFILSEIETSLNNFLADTTFPYTPSSQTTYPGGSNGTFGNGAAASGGAAVSGDAAASGRPVRDSSQASSGGQMPDAGQSTTGTAASGTTYETVQDYIDSLNSDTEWITYDSATGKATVTSVEAFVEHCKNATKSLGAFDEIDRGQGENSVFGDGISATSHFDSTLADLLKENADKYAQYSDWNASYVSDYSSDLAASDILGTSVQTRVDMYNPMYFLSSYYDGYGSSTVAKYWRIRTGIDQTDTALTVEANLALALQSNSNVKDVDFASVWGLGHTTAERTGDSTANFISWVNECTAAGQK